MLTAMILHKYFRTVLFLSVTHLCSSQSIFGCDEEWSRFKNKCFRLHEISVTFPEAIDICSKDPRAELATINSAEEQHFIETKVFENGKSSVWIGGIRASLSNQDEAFYWIGGEKFIYTNWFEGEPNNLRHEENCIAINSWRNQDHAKWYDNRCDDRLAVLCQKKVNGEMETDQASRFLANELESMYALEDDTYEEVAAKMKILQLLVVVLFSLIGLTAIFYISADFSEVSFICARPLIE
jgi:hypothetical protein